VQILKKSGAPEDIGYKVSDAEDVKGRRDMWESGKAGTNANEDYKKTAEERGYKVSDAEDIRKRREEWEQGKVQPSTTSKKADAEELGYKVSDAEDIKKRREEWEQGKVQPTAGSRKAEAEESGGYKVDGANIKDRLNQWSESEKGEPTDSGKGPIKAPIELPTRQLTMDDQTDVVSVNINIDEEDN